MCLPSQQIHYGGIWDLAQVEANLEQKLAIKLLIHHPSKFQSQGEIKNVGIDFKTYANLLVLESWIRNNLRWNDVINVFLRLTEFIGRDYLVLFYEVVEVII